MYRYDTSASEGGWYRRHMQHLRRRQNAMEKLREELDVLHFVRDTRITELLKRVMLNNRQCQSVAYFRRYTIKSKKAQA